MKKTSALPTVALLLAAAASTGCPTAVGEPVGVIAPTPETPIPPMVPPTDTADDGSAALTPPPDSELFQL